jgi:hypothetical protein
VTVQKKKKTIRMIPQARTPAREQDPKERARNFDEVALGYTADMAVCEALRCLGCKKASCMSGCPVAIAGPVEKTRTLPTESTFPARSVSPVSIRTE